MTATRNSRSEVPLWVVDRDVRKRVFQRGVLVVVLTAPVVALITVNVGPGYVVWSVIGGILIGFAFFLFVTRGLRREKVPVADLYTEHHRSGRDRDGF